MFHRSIQGDCRSTRTEHSEKQSHLGAVFPEGEAALSFLRIVLSSGSTATERSKNARRKIIELSERSMYRAKVQCEQRCAGSGYRD